MGGNVSGLFLVAVLGLIAVCCGLLIMRLYRSPAPRPASPPPGVDPAAGDPGEPGAG